MGRAGGWAGHAETIASIAERARADGVEAVIGMAGVQTNQYPRGRDLALQFRAAGFPVLFGGFHVSGYPESRAFLESCGVTTVVGEAETIWAEVLDDYLAGRLAPSYSVRDGIRARTGGADITVPLITDALSGVTTRMLASLAGHATLENLPGRPFIVRSMHRQEVMTDDAARDPRRWCLDPRASSVTA